MQMKPCSLAHRSPTSCCAALFPRAHIQLPVSGLGLVCVGSQSLQSCPTFCNPMDCSPPGSSVHGDSPHKNTGVGCHALLQGIFPTQGSNPGLPHCRKILYQLSYQGKSAAAAAKSLQSCPTLCNYIDGSSPGSPIPGILQARTLEWVAISFSSA